MELSSPAAAARGGTVIDPNTDPVIKEYRAKIAATDQRILDALNARIKLAKRLSAYKHSRGISYYDPEREEVIIGTLSRLNRGPLSNEGVRAIYTAVFKVARQEVEGARRKVTVE
jgi:chorismate mutase